MIFSACPLQGWHADGYSQTSRPNIAGVAAMANRSGIAGDGHVKGKGAELMRAGVGPRVLLRRLREVMAEPVNAQERLDRIVRIIAANMVAEVCSVYVLRVDGEL